MTNKIEVMQNLRDILNKAMPCLVELEGSIEFLKECIELRENEGTIYCPEFSEIRDDFIDGALNGK